MFFLLSKYVSVLERISWRQQNRDMWELLLFSPERLQSLRRSPWGWLQTNKPFLCKSASTDRYNLLQIQITINSTASDIQFCQAVFDQINNQTDAITVEVTTTNQVILTAYDASFLRLWTFQQSQNCFAGYGDDVAIKEAGCLPGTERKGHG